MSFNYKSLMNQSNVDADIIQADQLSASSMTVTDLTVYNETVNNDLTVGNNIIVSGTVDGVDISAFKTDYDSKINQDVRTTSSPTFSNITVSGTVDGVDVSSFKADYDSKVDQDVRTTSSPSFMGLDIDSLTILTAGTGNKITLAMSNPAAPRTYLIPDILTTGTFAFLQGTQTFTGAKTFSSALTINPVSNQLVLGSTRTVTLTAPTPATASRTHTIPDIAGNGTFCFLEGSQTFTGVKYFSDDIGTDPLGGIWYGDSAFTNGFYLRCLGSISGSRELILPQITTNSEVIIDTMTQNIVGTKNCNNINVSPIQSSTTSTQAFSNAVLLGVGATRNIGTFTMPVDFVNNATNSVSQNFSFRFTTSGNFRTGTWSFSSGIRLLSSSGATLATQTITTYNTGTGAYADTFTTTLYLLPAQFPLTVQWFNNSNNSSNSINTTIDMFYQNFIPLTINSLQRQLSFGRSFTQTLSVNEPSANRIITLPDLGSDNTFVLTSGAQTLANKTLTLPVISQISNTGTLTLPTSTDTLVGRATTDTLSNKTFSDTVTITPTSNQLVLGTTRTVTITAPTPATASRTHTIPDVGGNSSFVMTESNQTINGTKTFRNVNVTPTAGAACTINMGSIDAYALDITAFTGGINVSGANSFSFFRGDFYLTKNVTGSGTALVVDANSRVVRNSSSLRYKENIKDVIDCKLNCLSKLRTVCYNYKSESINQKNYGYIAEEVAQVLPEVVIFDSEGRPDSIKYQDIGILMNAQLLRTVDDLKSTKTEFKNQINQLVADLQTAQQRISTLETDRTNAQQRISTLETDRTSAQQRITALEADNVQLKQTVNSLIDAYTALKASVDSLVYSN